jgi:hypothetical protein
VSKSSRTELANTGNSEGEDHEDLVFVRAGAQGATQATAGEQPAGHLRLDGLGGLSIREGSGSVPDAPLPLACGS